jgi:PAS domain S-box-containing protein
MNAPLPPNEAQRLQSLQRLEILDTPPEPSFDRITRLATQLFGVPIALVSLVDQDRQWFKSCIGLDVRQTDRQLSFCAHAILSDEAFVVPDALLDARFADNELVTGETGIRFYAGAPLKGRDGLNVGSLCVIDTAPREFSEQDKVNLCDLAAMVVDELELRRAGRSLQLEIAERKQNEERLRLLESVVVTANDAILITEAEPVDEPGPRILYVNDSFTRMTGYSLEDVRGKTPRILQGPDTGHEARNKIRTALKRWRPVVVELINYHKDGTPFWVEISIVPVANEKGWFTHWVSVQRDVTQRKQSEESLRAAEERYRLLADNSLDLIGLLDLEGTVLYASPSHFHVLGYTDTELVNHNIFGIIHPDDGAPAGAAVQKLLASGQSQTVEVRLGHKSGQWLEVEAILSLVSNEGDNDGDKRILLSARDITLRKRASQQIRESQANLSALIENTADAVWSVDSDHRVLTFNSVLHDDLLGVFGRKTEVGTSVRQLVPPDIVDYWIALYDRALAGERFSLEQSYLVNGQTHFYDVAFNPIIAGDEVTGVAVFSKDITTRKQTEVALEAAKEEAERANRAKSEFLSRMSHELRTPMNAILGFAQLLEMDDLETTQRLGVEQILKGGRHLLTLINEVLDIARIEAGQLSLSPEPVRVSEVVREAMALVQPLAAAREVHFDNSVSSQSCHVIADRQRLKQVLLNLLSNAVKYNHHGGLVRLSCAPVGERVRIEVSDNGPGIPSNSLEKLFVPFERLGADQQGVEGAGIGLSICQRLVEAMNGRIGVHSVENEGSTFWVELPGAEDPLRSFERGEADAPSAPEEATSPRPSRVVLCIEDNLSNLKLIEHVLARRPEIQLLPAMQGRRGLELAREQKPDMILLDLHLPDMAGDEVLRHLRAQPETRDIPVVILSADATPGQIERLLAAGARDYLTKPLDVKRFLGVVEEVLKTDY